MKKSRRERKDCLHLTGRNRESRMYRLLTRGNFDIFSPFGAAETANDKASEHFNRQSSSRYFNGRGAKNQSSPPTGIGRVERARPCPER